METTALVRNKRKRIHGIYSCDRCDKHFSRSDHLSRHKRNHNPSDLKLKCDWDGCNLTFSRNDVKEKHYKRRHLKKSSFDLSIINDNNNDNNDTNAIAHSLGKLPAIGDLMNVNKGDSNPRDNGEYFSLSTDKSAMDSQLDGRLYRPIIHTFPQNRSGSMASTSAPQNFSPSRSKSSSAPRSCKSDLHRGIYDTQDAFTLAKVPGEIEESNDLFLERSTGDSANCGSPNDITSKPLSPSDLIEWLFYDDNDKHFTNTDNIGALSNMGFGESNQNSSPSFLDTLSMVSPNFPHHDNRINVDENIRNRMMMLIPTLQYNIDFGILHIQRYLEIYWLIFHFQYPILHRPSFSNAESNPLLLLAMVMMGASLFNCVKDGEDLLFENPKNLAQEIAEPLRWLIFSNKDCSPPAKVWVIQSILILEVYEITNSNRILHERGYLHHGTKVQILRRSPILGGDPFKDENEDGSQTQQNQLWKKWIEAESMKRATLMAFYLDTVNATVFGHMIILYAHQIKLSLPCDDSLWEFDNLGKNSDRITPSATPKFLAALKKVLNREKVNTNAFGKKILLAGLLSIMFQMQQKDLQLSILNWHIVKESWKDTLSHAFDVWKVEVSNVNDSSGIHNPVFSASREVEMPPLLRADDTRCKNPLYHIAQIYLQISHYDYIIFAGAPSRMNVAASSTEYNSVSERIRKWSTSKNGRLAAVHSYIFLIEMFLFPGNDDISYSYDPNNDPHLHRKNIIASAVLVVFAFNFSLEGPELDISRKAVSEYYPAKEDGYSYLKRMNGELMKGTGYSIMTLNCTDSTSYRKRINYLSDRLMDIKGKNNIVGLLKLAYKSYKSSSWEIGYEYSNLFKNCIERSLGRKDPTCRNMYVSGNI